MTTTITIKKDEGAYLLDIFFDRPGFGGNNMEIEISGNEWRELKQMGIKEVDY